MEDEFDPEFRQLVHKLVVEKLAQEANAGRSWRAALEQIKDILNIDPKAIEPAVEQAVETLRRPGPGLPDKKNDSAWTGPSPPFKTDEYVRQQVFEVVVRQGMAGAPWRDICATPMRVNNIDPEDVQREIDNRRKKLEGHQAM